MVKRGYHFEKLESLAGTETTGDDDELPMSDLAPSRDEITVPASERPQTGDEA